YHERRYPRQADPCVRHAPPRGRDGEGEDARGGDFRNQGAGSDRHGRGTIDMKRAACILAALLVAAPASAQCGGLINNAEKGNEAELAGVLGHEITHVTAKHTVRAIQKSKGISMGSDQVAGSSLKGVLIARMAQQAYHLILDGEFSREDENEADKVGVQLANK